MNNSGFKNEMSQSYMNGMRMKHADKPIRLERRAVIIGHEEGNIGEAIGNRLFIDGFEFSGYSLSNTDIRNPFDRHKIFQFNTPDVLILGNGYTDLNWIENQDDHEINEMIDNTLTASIKMTRDFVKNTIDEPYRKYIVYIGSMAYKSVLNASSPYCAAKAGLSHFMKCMAWELAPKGYNVFCVNPSNVKGTPMSIKTIEDIMRYRGIDREGAEKYWASSLPKWEWLTKEEVAEAVAFLVSGKADYLSGTNIDMAGGQR